MITQNLADRLDWLTDLAVLSFDRMVEIELLEGRTDRYRNARHAYERHLERLGQAITDAVGVPTQRKEEPYYARFR